MSGSALGFIQGGVADAVTVMLRPQRDIGGIVADAVVEEDKEDRLHTTDHPVEQGAVITDHAYKMPAQVTLVYGFSASSLRSGGDPLYLRNIYDKLRQLQINRTLVTIVTGRRIYVNMLLEAVREQNTKETENGMIVRVTAKEIIIAATQTVVLSGTPKDAAKTAPTTSAGLQQPRPAPSFNPTVLP